MNKMKLMSIMILAAASFGVTLSSGKAQAQGISICSNGICLERQHDGSGVDLRPDFRFPPGRRPPPRPMPPRPWPGPPSRGYEFITCESRDQRLQNCYFNPQGVRRVNLDQQHSQAACIPGRTYGIQRDFVWVDQGCRATFLIDRY